MDLVLPPIDRPGLGDSAQRQTSLVRSAAAVTIRMRRLLIRAPLTG
jgi:hypothetical protein